MRLDEFLERSQIHHNAFAKAIGTVPETVRRYIRGHRLPGWDVMLRIEAATRGTVTPNDWLEIAKARAKTKRRPFLAEAAE